MKGLLLLLLAGSAAPALAQPAVCPPEHAAMGHCTPAPAPTPTPAPQPAPADPHAGHAMPAPAVPDPHAGHAMPGQSQPAPDPHAGHDMTAVPADVPLGPPPPEALQGPEHAGDTVWGRGQMDASRAVLFREHGGLPAYKLLVDQLEARVRSGRDGYFLDAEGWYGGDIDKLWLKAEVEGDFGRQAEKAEFQALWSHAIDPWFDLQAGLRLDAEPETRGHFVFGLQGLAPFWIEVDAAAFLSDKGDLTARVEAEHDARITRTLVLQPRAELNVSLQDIPRRHLGSGLTTAELGLRLRYEIVPNFAPYVGVHYERAFGGTRKVLRREGDDLGGVSFVTGIRAWF
jgi:copper resistance protein B